MTVELRLAGLESAWTSIRLRRTIFTVPVKSSQASKGNMWNIPKIGGLGSMICGATYRLEASDFHGAKGRKQSDSVVWPAALIILIIMIIIIIIIRRITEVIEVHWQ